MKITELLCFGVQPGQGNPALVVQGDDWNTDQRQRFAHAQQRSACVFVDAVADADADGGVVLDYFYPHTRSPLCLHATLAAAAVLLDDGGGVTHTLTVRTALRGQQLHLSRTEAGLFIALQRQSAPAVALAPELPSRLLALPGVPLASPPVIASAGSPKLLLELPDCATLQALRPDLALLAAWGKEHGVNGCYAWARRADGALEGRNFNHLDPELEDSATGVAAAALTLHLGHGVHLHQGANRGQPCLLRTALQGYTVQVGGAAQAVPYVAVV